MKKLSLLAPRNIIRTWLSVWGVYMLLDISNFFLPRFGSLPNLFAAISQVTFWLGAALTVIVFVLLYQGKGTDSKFNPRWILYAWIGAWIAYLLFIGSGRFMSYGSWALMWVMVSLFQIAILLTLPALAVAFLGLSKASTPRSTNISTNVVVLRVVGACIIAALAIGTYAAIRTLFTSIDAGKFVYNNTANGLGCAAFGLTLILSYLQRDVYWLNRSKAVKLDEWQIQERQQVFEISYKLSALLVFAAFCAVFTHKHSLLTLVQNDSYTPGNILWPFANLVITLFALPLLVATYRMRRPRSL